MMLTYGVTAIGATVHLHYCMDEYAGWSLFHEENDTCGRCGMDESEMDGCCKDEHKYFQLKTDHQKSGAVQLITFIFSPVIIIPEINISFPSFQPAIEQFPVCHAPPDIGKSPLHILNCTFLI